MMHSSSDLPDPRYTQSKRALFTAMKTGVQAGKKKKSLIIFRLLTGSDADEIIATCQHPPYLGEEVHI